MTWQALSVSSRSSAATECNLQEGQIQKLSQKLKNNIRPKPSLSSFLETILVEIKLCDTGDGFCQLHIRGTAVKHTNSELSVVWVDPQVGLGRAGWRVLDSGGLNWVGSTVHKLNRRLRLKMASFLKSSTTMYIMCFDCYARIRKR